MNRPNRIAVLGGKGMLGTDLVATLTTGGWVPTDYDLPEFDLSDPRHVQHALDQADVVINCAAYTNVDGAEADPETAYRVNAEAVGQLGRLAAPRGIPVVHISTDFVFDGRSHRPYREDDPVGPLGVYGASKLKGEQLLAQSGCACCMVRVQWTYGAAGNNFIEKILTRARSGGPLKVVDDQIGAPTSTLEVSRTLADLLALPSGLPEGLFHFAAAGYVSRYDVARFVLDRMKLKVELSACQSSDFVSPAQRPLSSRFDCSKIAGLLTQPIQPWQIPLEHYLEQR